MIDPEEIKNHPYYNPFVKRILLPVDECMKLPIKEVTPDELYDIRCTWQYNPTHYIPDGSFIGEGIVGHDLNYRYKLKLPKEE